LERPGSSKPTCNTGGGRVRQNVDEEKAEKKKKKKSERGRSPSIKGDDGEKIKPRHAWREDALVSVGRFLKED